MRHSSAVLLSLALGACVGDKGGLVLHNSDPEATIESPADGTTVREGDALTLRGVVGDTETAPADLTVSWLVDGTAVCGDEAAPDEAGVTTCEVTLDASAELVLAVYDAKSASAEDTVSITVTPNTPPQIALDAPVAGGAYLTSQPVALAAVVSDAEDAPEDLAVSWSVAGEALEVVGASIDSSGSYAATASLPVGTHTLTATATDPLGKTGTDTVTIDVIEDTGAPVCSLSAPADGAVFPPGSDVTVEGRVSDAASPVSALRATLASDVDGELVEAVGLDADGELSEVVAGLTDGPHVLTLTGWDGAGNTCEATVSIGLCDAVWYRDGDGDGHGDPADSVVACAAPSGFVALGDDCDDTTASVSPSATEVCDPADVDEDCDGLSDDTDPSIDTSTWATWHADTDSDTFGDAAATALACDQPTGFVADSTDCDDTDAAVNPAATEVCDADDVDEDCDGLSDDIDPSIDASTMSTWHADTDSDSYGDPAATTPACDQPTGFVADSTDCDDTDAAVNPAATEVCDAADVDEDCDGLSDDADSSVDPATLSTWHADTDSDSYGDAATTTDACDAPSGFVADSTDCDDSDSAVNPAATEVCDTVDNDCDGAIDDDDASVDAATFSTWHDDSDGDGFGDAASSSQACAAPSGTVADATDCDDRDAQIYPGAAEVCDGDDNDCDGDTDDDDASLDLSTRMTFYADSDFDGYGDPGAPVEACDAPSGTVPDSGDCDDSSSSIYPGAREVCDGIDNDCNGDIDDDDAGLDTSTRSTWYADSDGDGYGDASASTAACSAPSDAVADATDCDDTRDSVYPGATELCDGVQSDCSSTTWTSDAGLASFYSDATGTWSDVTSAWAVGTASGPAAIILGSAGQLNLCEATWYANVELQAEVDIVGVDGAELVVLDGGGVDSVVTVLTSGLTVGLSDLTLTGGEGTVQPSFSSAGYLYGGGVICDTTSTLMLEDLVVTGNHAEVGGGLATSYCDVSATDVTWQANTASVHSAGVYATYGDWSEAGGHYDGNAAPAGGGARFSTAQVVLDDTSFTDNTSTVGGYAAFMVGQSSTLDATGLTVTGSQSGTNASGGSYYGGAVWLYSSVTATIEDASFTDNHSDNITGALYLYSSELDCTDCTFDANTAQGPGGALYVRTSSTLTLDGTSAITNNESGGYGGGMIFGNSTGTLTDVTITGNAATSYAGGVGIIGSSTTTTTLSMSGVELSDNTTDSYGGGIVVNHADVDLSDTTLARNTSAGDGGGAYLATGAVVTVDGAELDENTATGDGGGIYSDDADELTILDTTFTDNEGTEGGGLACFNGDCSVDGSTFTANHATSTGGAISVEGGDLQLTSSTISTNTSDNSNGGVRFDGSTTSGTISGCTFDANEGLDSINGGGGAALVVRYGATVSVSTTDFTDNVSSNPSGGMNGGGAVWAWSGSTANTIDFDAVTFDGNTSAAHGGAGWFHNSDVTMTDSTISSNEADERGGGLYLYSSALELDTVDLTANVSDDDGAGVLFYNSTFDILDSSFTSNSSTSGKGGAFYVQLSTGDIVTTRFDLNNPYDTYHAASADVDNWSRTGATFSCTSTSCY